MKIPKFWLYFLILVFSLLTSIILCYFIASFAFNRYFDSWGDRLVDLEKRGMLSKEFGAAWQDILEQDKMQVAAKGIINGDSQSIDNSMVSRKDQELLDYPSLSIVARLNEVHVYSNTIRINDRFGRRVATIRTDHTRAKINEFPKTLLHALLAAEDKQFYKNNLGFEFKSFVRSFGRALLSSLVTFSLPHPSGTSTITQQVAKLFVSYVDESGQRRVSKSIDRKIQELRLSAALRKMYTPDEIFEVYLNHCIATDYGLIGVKDIAKGLFSSSLDSLTDAQCIYISRMIKWGRNIYPKIRLQCHIDMPRMASSLQWDLPKQQQVLNEIDSMTFSKPRQIVTESGHLIDLANVFWLNYYKKNFTQDTSEISLMDLGDPSSLIRRKGNLTIRLTLDMPLQRALEQMVNSRGYGKDTTIYNDVRIGSFGEDIHRKSKPEDTIRFVRIMAKPYKFSEPGSNYTTTLEQGDTLISNIRYTLKQRGLWHRSIFYYSRRPVRVEGQYYAYCIIDSKTGTILAYYSRDKIGSRCAGLLRNRTPNGSSTAKPIMNALNFDLGLFQPYEKWTDSTSIREDVPWKRYVIRKDGAPHEVVFEQSSIAGKGYKMHNHNYQFEGCQYIFDQLNTSNNILGVETMYRPNRKVFDADGNILQQAYAHAQFFYRLNILDKMKNKFPNRVITGVRLYRELVRIVGADADSIISVGKKSGISDSLYSIALGTLELSLFEQIHLFNVFNNNELIERPIDHPSLVIDSVTIDGVSLSVAQTDTVRRYHPFTDMNLIRPTLLGLHKRLVSNAADGLSDYDIEYLTENEIPIDSKSYDPNVLSLEQPVANIAKSGTTNDVLRPFNVDATSNKRTNYGIWNAIIRVDLGRLVGDSEPDIRDITIACIGECNQQFTGERDGKTLHKFVTLQLLKRIGITNTHGFFKQYENYIKTITPDSAQSCQEPPTPVQPGSDSLFQLKEQPIEAIEDSGDIW